MVSWMAAIALLRYFFLKFDLHKIAVLHQFFDLFLGQLQHVAGCLLELLLFFGVEVRPVALRETITRVAKVLVLGDGCSTPIYCIVRGTTISGSRPATDSSEDRGVWCTYK